MSDLEDALCTRDDGAGGLAHAICIQDVKAWLQARKSRFSAPDLQEDLTKLGYRLYIPNPEGGEKARRGVWYVLKGGNLEANPPKGQVMIRADLFDEVADRIKRDLAGFRTEELLFISEEWKKRLARFLKRQPSEAAEEAERLARAEAAKAQAEIDAKIDEDAVPF